MRRLLWVFAWIAVALWSLFAFAGYGIVDLMGGAAMRNADMFSSDPETVEWIFRVLSWTRSVSVSVILVVWGLVSLAILAVPWIIDRIAAATSPPQPYARPNQAGRDGVIDLAPGDYSVRSGGPGVPGAEPRSAGPAPLIARRP